MSQQYDTLIRFLSSSREALAPIRSELADWFRTDIKKRKGSKNSTGLQLVYITDSESLRPKFHFDWYPMGSSRSLIFKTSQDVPAFSTMDDAQAVGAEHDGVYQLRYLALEEMVADAWIDADGFTFRKPLYIIKWLFDKPDSPRLWINNFLELNEYYKTRKSVPQTCFRPSEPIPLPRVPVHVIPSIREGDPDCLQDWANAFERANIPSYAELLRWLPTFTESIREEVQAVSPSMGFSIVPNLDGSASWWIGDMDSETPNSDAQNLGKLLSAWNTLYPAIEWFLRMLRLPNVQIETLTLESNTNPTPRRVSFQRDAHLTELNEGEAVVRLFVEGWE